MASTDSGLPNYVRERLRRVIETTGYPVVVEQVGMLEFDSEVGYGSADSPRHQIRVSHEYVEHRAHFILSSLAKIQRFFDAPDTERRVPVVDMHGRLAADEELELARRAPGVSRQVLLQMSNHLHVGLARQLLSFPLDLRVEQELYGAIHEHHGLQIAYLTRQVGDFEAHFSREIEAFSPPKTYAASSAMNYALAHFCADVTGEALPRPIRRSPHAGIGRNLLHLLEKLADVPGHVGDRQLQDAWATTLGLQHLYSWSRDGR